MLLMKLTRVRHSAILALLSISLAALTHPLAFGQSSGSDKQNPVTVEVISQPNSPLIITLTGLNNFFEHNLVINYSVKNIGEKKIAAFIVTQYNPSASRDGGMDFFTPLAVGQTIDSWNIEPKTNLESNSKIFLAIGYILFSDGTSWGESTKDETDFIYGFIEGQKKILSELKRTAKTDKAVLVRLLEQENFIIGNSQIDRIEKLKPEEWKARHRFEIGYRVGYIAVWVELKQIYKKLGIEMLPLEPNEFYNSVEPMRVNSSLEFNKKFLPSQSLRVN
jgi:hypothetical protein